MNVNIPLEQKQDQDNYYELRSQLARQRKTVRTWFKETMAREVAKLKEGKK